MDGFQSSIQVDRLRERVDASERRARRSEIREKVVRLAAEVELDESAEVDRLCRLTDVDVDSEIARM